VKKIIFTFQEIGNKLDFDLLFTEKGFKGNKIVNRYHHSLSSVQEFFDGDNTELINSLQLEITTEKFNRSAVTVVLGSDELFLERLTLPVLSAGETAKSFNLEMEKIYGNYKSRFVTSAVASKIDKHLNLHKVVFYRLTKYRYLVEFIKKLGLSLDHVIIKPEALKNALLHNFLVDTHRNVLFVNVGENMTDLLLLASGKIESFTSVNCGLSNVDSLIASSLGITKNEAEVARINPQSISITGKYSTINDFFEEGLDDVILKIKMVIGSYYDKMKIDQLLINSENGSNDKIISALERKVREKVVPLKLNNQRIVQNFSNYGGLYSKVASGKNFYF
jgi:hypothetical protein